MTLATPKTPNAYDTAFTYTLNGIPCTIVLREISFVKPVAAQYAHSDLELKGELYYEAFVYDRKGYHAPWLQRKLKEQNYEDFTIEALNYLEGYDYDVGN